MRFRARPLCRIAPPLSAHQRGRQGHGAGAPAPVAGDAPRALLFDYLIGAQQN
jgi:hypothetical protein